MAIRQKKLSKWFTDWRRKINKELSISPEFEVVWVTRKEQKELNGEYLDNIITLRLHPNNSRSKIKYLYCHEARHCWQETQNTDDLWNDTARKRLIKLIQKATPALKDLCNDDIEAVIYEKTNLYDCLPEEVDANVYAYEKTKYRFKN